MKKISLIAVLLVFSLVLSGCIHNQAAQTPEDEAVGIEVISDDTLLGDGAQDDEEISEGAMVDLTSEQSSEATVALSANNFSYSTTEIRVKQGTKLTIEVTNDEGFHDLLIDELNVNSEMIPAGETVELVIPTDTVGEFEYYCSVGNHRDMGMKGMLIIEE